MSSEAQKKDFPSDEFIDSLLSVDLALNRASSDGEKNRHYHRRLKCFRVTRAWWQMCLSVLSSHPLNPISQNIGREKVDNEKKYFINRKTVHAEAEKFRSERANRDTFVPD